MKAVIQRVSSAQVDIEQNTVGKIGPGFLILLGVGDTDTEEDSKWLTSKISQLRVFSDEEGKMNKSILDLKGEALVISQFTLHAKYKKGTRPSFIHAAKPELATRLYEHFKTELSIQLGKPIASGEFGADMQVSLVNDGPVTLCLDTKNKE